MLVEIGDDRYNFVHLTFQEYLTERHVDDRWHEVVRLLIAELSTNTSQEFFIEKILAEKSKTHHIAQSRLLGGLLLDGIGVPKLMENC